MYIHYNNTQLGGIKLKAGTIDPVYEITETRVKDKYLGEITSYGINGRDAATGETFSAERLTFDKNFAERLSRVLTENGVSVVQAGDVIRDLIIEAAETV